MQSETDILCRVFRLAPLKAEKGGEAAMKKLILLTMLAVLAFPSASSADDSIITAEDFEKYSLTEKYNTGSLKVSYPGLAEETLTNEYIINAPGGIYTGDEVYEGNAAENIVTYAQTSDTEAIAVRGGLNNGWHGFYSHPMLYLAGGQGISSEFNKYNRRVAVVKSGTGKVLNLSAPSNNYVDASCWYGYDEIDFSKPVLWESDIKIGNMADKGAAYLSLTKNKFAEMPLLAYPGHDCGRTGITPVIEFLPDGKIMFGGEEIGQYSKNVFYRVSLFMDAGDASAACRLTIKEVQSGDAVVSELPMNIDYDFTGITGVEYYTKVASGANASSEVQIDNISIKQVIFSGVIKTTATADINGKGVMPITFSSLLNRETVNNDTIKVYHGGELVEGTNVSVLNSTVVRLSLPVLSPSEYYTVKIDGVMSESGLRAECETEFKSKDAFTLSSAKIASDAITFKLKNNSSESGFVTVLAVLYSENKILPNGVLYKRMTADPGGTINGDIDISNVSGADSAVIYCLDTISAFRAAAPPQTVADK